MHKDYERVFLTREEIAARVGELGRALSRDYEGKNPLFICILKGSVFFFSDLLRALTIPAEIEFMSASSYGNSDVSSGIIKLKKDIDCSIEGRHVIIVEDIMDTGHTLSLLKTMLGSRSPASLALCTLLDKPSRRVVEIEPDYCGFSVPDEFLVGYGLDYAEKYRMEPDIYILSRAAYQK